MIIACASIGGLIGFITFVRLLESGNMGKIIWREGQFTPNGVWKYIKSPFFQHYLWHWKLWQHNWIIMTTSGVIMGSILATIF